MIFPCPVEQNVQIFILMERQVLTTSSRGLIFQSGGGEMLNMKWILSLRILIPTKIKLRRFASVLEETFTAIY